jgi:hypothetical protein
VTAGMERNGSQHGPGGELNAMALPITRPGRTYAVPTRRARRSFGHVPNDQHRRFVDVGRANADDVASWRNG